MNDLFFKLSLGPIKSCDLNRKNKPTIALCQPKRTGKGQSELVVLSKIFSHIL